MKINRLRIALSVSLAFGLALTLTAPFASAQEDGPAWLDVRIMEVKPGRAAEFRELVGRLTAAVAEAGRPPIAVYQEVRGNLANYHLVTAQTVAANFDADLPPPLPAGAWANLLNRLGDTVQSQQRLLLRNYPGISVALADGVEPAEFMLLRLRTVVTGGNGEYEDWLRDSYVPALVDGGVQDIGVARVVAGDSPGIWAVSSPIENWAQYDEPGPFSGLSDREAERLFGPNAALVETRENLVLRRRPGLMAP